MVISEYTFVSTARPVVFQINVQVNIVAEVYGLFREWDASENFHNDLANVVGYVIWLCNRVYSFQVVCSNHLQNESRYRAKFKREYPFYSVGVGWCGCGVGYLPSCGNDTLIIKTVSQSIETE